MRTLSLNKIRKFFRDVFRAANIYRFMQINEIGVVRVELNEQIGLIHLAQAITNDIVEKLEKIIGVPCELADDYAVVVQYMPFKANNTIVGMFDPYAHSDQLAA